MKQFALLIALVAGIPVFGLAVGGYIRSDFQKEWLSVVSKEIGEKGVKAIRDGTLSLDSFCRGGASDIRSACETYQNVTLLFDASLWCLATGLFLLLGIHVAAKLAGSNRGLLVALFAPGLRVVLLVLFGLILAQGAILVYGLYIGEAYAIKRVHYFLIGAVGLGALFGSFSMIRAGMAISKRARSVVLGEAVTESEQPKLWALVRNIASSVDAKMPRNIVLGIAPNFYVTSADVQVFPSGKSYSDETLYLSLPLLRLLSHEQLAAVVGHELGHFKGEDTRFSLRFYPIYSGTSQAIESLNSRMEGAQGLALLPALAILSFFMRCFSVAENTIGRQREFEADKVGASVTSGRALSVALLKIGAIVPLWASVKSAMIDALSEGRMFTNVSELYATAARERTTLEGVAAVADYQMAHPTDTHPTTLSRIAALGLTVDELKQEAMAFESSNNGISLLENVEKVEKELSDVEHRILVETGQVVIPQNPTTDSAEAPHK